MDCCIDDGLIVKVFFSPEPGEKQEKQYSWKQVWVDALDGGLIVNIYFGSAVAQW